MLSLLHAHLSAFDDEERCALKRLIAVPIALPILLRSSFVLAVLHILFAILAPLNRTPPSLFLSNLGSAVFFSRLRFRHRLASHI
jgi:hypothetical protein